MNGGKSVRHPLSLMHSPRVPRSLDAATARAEAPATNETPDPDAVLLASLVSAVKTLQGDVLVLQREVERW